MNQAPLPDPCPGCGGLVVAARDEARRCTACGRAWDREGRELPEDRAGALVPRPRGGGRRAKPGGRGRAGAGTAARTETGTG